MKIIILNNKQRKRIVKNVKPNKKDFYSYQNLDLLTAVSDDDEKFILTMAYYLSSSIRRTDENYDEYKYVLLTKLGVFNVSCISTAGEYTGVHSPLPLLISNEDILEMIRYYCSGYSERRNLRKQEEKKMDLEGKDYTEWYLEKNYWL